MHFNSRTYEDTKKASNRFNAMPYHHIIRTDDSDKVLVTVLYTSFAG
jgi:hypothetical protein